jgi:hypothetical protein
MNQGPALSILGEAAEKLLLDLPWGSRSKRDWELGMLEAALQAGRLPGVPDALAAKLRVSQRKARALLDELELRQPVRDPAVLDRALRDEVLFPYLRARRLSLSKQSDRIEFHIDRLVLRERFRQIVREQYGLVERGLDGTLLSVEPEVFITVVLELTGVKPDSLPVKTSSAPSDRQVSVFRLFAEEFAKSAGKTAGSRAVEWAERLMTAGLSDALVWMGTWRASSDDHQHPLSPG